MPHREDQTADSHRDRDRDRDRRSHRRRDSRSRSPARRRHRSPSPSRSESPDTHTHTHTHSEGPPSGVAQIHEDDDYFRKATELKLWLWEEKHKVRPPFSRLCTDPVLTQLPVFQKLDSLRTQDARRYFRKFCRAWNRGRLSANYYQGISPASLPSSISSSHSWSFSKASQADLDAAASIRKSIDTGTKTRSYEPSTAAPAPAPRRLGPTLPPSATAVAGPSSSSSSSAVERLQLERDARDSVRQAERVHVASERRRENRESRQEERDSRATGRDRLVEKRREGNLARREYEGAREAGGMVEIDDETLMGGGPEGGQGGFEAALRERERQQRRREERRVGKIDEKKAELTDRYQAYKGKEDQTMAMFKQLAAARFGAGAGGT
ncbi:hypothetical protein JCM3774_005754 [Rhodotorula dairenensis]